MTAKAQQLVKTDKTVPDWFPADSIALYHQTDLTYEFCLGIFAKVEATKRENFAKETMRLWFIEFIKRGWTKAMLQKRYEALLSKQIYGVERLDFADWVNAVPVYGLDEVNLMVDRKIESILQRGKFLRNKEIALTDGDKKFIECSILKEEENKIFHERLLFADEYMKQYRDEILPLIEETREKYRKEVQNIISDFITQKDLTK